jgi:hypothetical protein
VSTCPKNAIRTIWLFLFRGFNYQQTAFPMAETAAWVMMAQLLENLWSLAFRWVSIESGGYWLS